MSKVANESGFMIGDSVVYPSHGVGQIIAEETEVIGGVAMQLYVISFINDKMTLRVPKSRTLKAGLRPLSSSLDFDHVDNLLRSKAKTARGMWSKRAQEYENKINSGVIVDIAEVLRDLHKNIDDQGRSYSERVIYESALERLSKEYSVARSINVDAAREKIISILNAGKEEYEVEAA